MEVVTLELTKAQVTRLHLLVKYEIKRNEVLSKIIFTSSCVEHCRLENDSLFGILDLLRLD